MLISSLGWLNRPATGVVHLLLIERYDQGANHFLSYQFCLIGEHIGGGGIGILGKLRVKAFSPKVFISYTFHQPRFYKLFSRITTGLRTTDPSNIDAGSYSFPYVTRSAEDRAVLRRNLAEVQGVAAGLIAGIEEAGS